MLRNKYPLKTSGRWVNGSSLSNLTLLFGGLLAINATTVFQYAEEKIWLRAYPLIHLPDYCVDS